MSIENEKINFNVFPLYIHPSEIYNFFLKCLNFVENDLFEIVQEKNKESQNISIDDLIRDGISPRLSSKSRHGICLRSNLDFYERKSDLKVIYFHDLPHLPRKLKIIQSIDDVNCFCLVPKEDLCLFEYKLLVTLFCQDLSLKS